MCSTCTWFFFLINSSLNKSKITFYLSSFPKLIWFDLFVVFSYKLKYQHYLDIPSTPVFINFYWQKNGIMIKWITVKMTLLFVRIRLCPHPTHHYAATIWLPRQVGQLSRLRQRLLHRHLWTMGKRKLPGFL